jgi:hypothetical protein
MVQNAAPPSYYSGPGQVFRPAVFCQDEPTVFCQDETVRELAQDAAVDALDAAYRNLTEVVSGLGPAAERFPLFA